VSRAPHPALRRLHALGGAPARAMERLAAPLAALDRLAGDLEGLDLLSDRAIAPLVREIDLAGPLDRVLGPAAGNEPAEAPGAAAAPPTPAAVHKPAPKRLAPTPPDKRLAPMPAPEGRVRSAHHPLGSDRPNGAHSAPYEAPAGARGGPVGRGRGPSPPAPLPSPFHPPPGEGRKEAPAQSSCFSPLSPGRGAGGEGASRRTSGTPSTAATEKRLAPIAPAPDLRARAERAGSTTAADRPVGASPDPAVAAVLARATAARPAAASETAGAGLLLARALDRLADRRAGRDPRRPPAADDGSPAPLAPPRPPAPALRPLRPAAAAAGRVEGTSRLAPPEATGLRRLAALATAPVEPEAATSPDRGAPAALPAAVRERLEEAALGARLERLLRREAARQGLDLAEAAP